MRKLLRVINIVLFIILLLQLLRMYTDFEVNVDSLYRVGFLLLFAICFFLFCLYQILRAPLTDNGMVVPSMQGPVRSYRIVLVIASAIAVFFLFSILWLYFYGGSDAGWAILGLIILGTIFAVGMGLTIVFGILQKAFSSNGTGQIVTRREWMFPSLLCVALVSLVLLEHSSLSFCAKSSCRFSIFHRHPEICHRRQYYFWHCFIETAMYYKDEQFCDNIRAEDMRAGQSFETEIDRCKAWVRYAETHPVSLDSPTSAGPWSSGRFPEEN